MQSKDEVFVQKAMEGDRDAFGQLVSKYKNMVYGLAYHLVGNSAEAQDLSQEAFLQAYLRLSQLKRPAKFASWLKQITANICKILLDCQRKSNIRTSKRILRGLSGICGMAMFFRRYN